MDKQTSDQQYNRMTQTPVHSLVIQLCIPTVISMLVTNIYNMVDTAFVGKLGNSASGAVGVVFGFMAILQAVGFLFGQGAGVSPPVSWDRRSGRRPASPPLPGSSWPLAPAF